jgi:uncharacterized repeat protein (TIGR03803 family)
LAIDSQGDIFGTARNFGTGCPTLGCGTVFELAPPVAEGQAWRFSVIYHFQGGDAGQQPSNGVVLDQQGNVYGSALFDPDSGRSLIFKLTPPAGGAGEWTESVLYRLYPRLAHCSAGGPLAIDRQGALYGVFNTYCNNSTRYDEYVYQLTPTKSDPNVWVKIDMNAFGVSRPAGGYAVAAPLTVDANGNVYGATLVTGTDRNPGTGNIYVLTPRPGSPARWDHKVVFSFALDGVNASGNVTGTYPNGGLVFDSAGALYGTTVGGGTADRGVFFRLPP